MSDYEKYTNLLNELCVSYDVKEIASTKEIMVTITANQSTKVKGYSGFVMDAIFDETKSFKVFGIWE